MYRTLDRKSELYILKGVFCMALVCTDFQNFLSTAFQDRLVAVEFECGGLCKKAIGLLTCIAPDFIRLTSPLGSFVRVSIFFGTECPIEECADQIIIKKCKIVSVEACPAFGTCPPILTTCLPTTII